ncbi:MAG TPA: hypothetical protein VH300_06450 [Thermoleophilaceae bacterium]|nr:hypothetical protein [Thermoleophilaceae bacterium]
MAFADDFQRIIDSLPPDWSYLQFDLRINDEDRYVELAPIVAEVNAWPLSKADYHWRFNVAREFGHAAAPESVHGNLAKLDGEGITGEIVVRHTRSGRVPVEPMWGRPESVRREFAERYSQ